MEELTQLLAQHGLLVVFVNVLMTQAGVPVPAIPMLVVSGAFVAEGQIGWASLVAVTLVASLIGDSLWYAAGRRYGARYVVTVRPIDAPGFEKTAFSDQQEQYFLYDLNAP